MNRHEAGTVEESKPTPSLAFYKTQDSADDDEPTILFNCVTEPTTIIYTPKLATAESITIDSCA